MNVTEPIIQAALLGTANREFVPGAFPESLQTLVDGIHGKAEDTESFLSMTAASATGVPDGNRPERKALSP